MIFYNGKIDNILIIKWNFFYCYIKNGLYLIKSGCNEAFPTWTYVPTICVFGGKYTDTNISHSYYIIRFGVEGIQCTWMHYHAVYGGNQVV